MENSQPGNSQPDNSQHDKIDMLNFCINWDCSTKEVGKLDENLKGLESSIAGLVHLSLNDLCEHLKKSDCPDGSNQRPNTNIRDVVNKLEKIDPTAGVLALQRLYVKGWIDSFYTKVHLRMLRRWRCNAPFTGYKKICREDTPLACLKYLTIFGGCGVPLFIDNYGSKRLLSDFTDGQEEIVLNADTTIYHVTHSQEANKIKRDKNLKPSDNKNAIKGTWFGVPSCRKPLQGELISPYGSVGFKTTLGKLGVPIKNLHQGEIVTYKREINVILYVEQDPRDDGEKLMIPKTEEYNDEHISVSILRTKHSDKYINVSIFVPENVIDAIEGDRFDSVFKEEPVPVDHSGFCVKEKRSYSPKQKKYTFECPDKKQPKQRLHLELEKKMKVRDDNFV